MRSAIDRVAENHVGDRVGIVSHGAAIRAFTASVVGITFRDRHRLALPTNASVAHVLIGPLGSTLMDYNLPGG